MEKIQDNTRGWMETIRKGEKETCKESSEESEQYHNRIKTER